MLGESGGASTAGAPMDRTEKLLTELSDGDEAAASLLYPLVYEQLRSLARSYFRKQPAGHTLQPTALVNEAFLKVIRNARVDWKSRAHVASLGATAMRQILIDHARSRLRRGKAKPQVSFEDSDSPVLPASPDVLALHRALEKLVTLDVRQARIVELRFFGGMTVAEVAHVLRVSKTTVESDMRMAKAWLHRELMDHDES